MSVEDFDEVFKSKVVSTAQLSAREAKLAFAALVMWCDGEIKMEELKAMSDSLIDGQFDQQAMAQASAKVSRIYHDEGPGALFNAAIKALPKEELENAFELAVKTALADREITDEEREYVEAFAVAMQIGNEKFHQVVAGTPLAGR